MKKKVVLCLLTATILVGVVFVVTINNEDKDSKTKKEELFNMYSLSMQDSFTADSNGRISKALAVIGKDTASEYETSVELDFTPAGYSEEVENLYCKCQLVSSSLLGRFQIEDNIFTGTTDLQKELKKYENKVYKYISETGNHVFYEVVPNYGSDKDIIPSSLSLSAYSYEDMGEGLYFNVTCKNIQEGMEIDYETGEAKAKKN